MTPSMSLLEKHNTRKKTLIDIITDYTANKTNPHKSNGIIAKFSKPVLVPSKLLLNTEPEFILKRSIINEERRNLNMVAKKGSLLIKPLTTDPVKSVTERRSPGTEPFGALIKGSVVLPAINDSQKNTDINNKSKPRSFVKPRKRSLSISIGNDATDSRTEDILPYVSLPEEVVNMNATKFNFEQYIHDLSLMKRHDANPNYMKEKSQMQYLEEQYETLIKTNPHLGLTRDECFYALQAFSTFDTDRSGSITEEELSQAIGKIGMDVDENQIKAMIRGVDANSDGCVTIDEFINLMLQLRKRKQFLSSNSELHEAFLLCDLNKDGFLDKYDIYALFKDVGDHITMEMAAEMVDCVKSDSSGCISMSDFMRLALSRLTRL